MGAPLPQGQRDAAGKNAVVAIAATASFLTPFMASSVNLALPRIGQEFSMDAVLLGWVASSYLLAAAMFLVPFGRLADIHGRKRLFLCGMAVYSTSSLLVAVSPSAPLLILFRAMQGTGGAMIFGTAVAILTSAIPPEQRGRALGVNVAAVYLGLSLGPFVGGFLTQHFGWRSIFFINVPLGLTVVALALWRLKGEWAEARGERFDLVGAVVYSLSLVALMYGFSRLPGAPGFVLVLLGLLGVTGFAWWESRSGSPVLNTGLFRRNTVFAFSNLAALVNYSATAGVGFLLSLYLQYTKGLSPQNAGLVLVSQPVVMTVLSPFAGRLSDSIEPRAVASAGMALTFVGLCLLAFLGEDTGLAFIVGSLVLLGFGFALFSSPNTNAVMSSVEKRFYGVASGTLGTMRLTGQMLSLGIVMIIFAVVIGRVEITPEYYHSFLVSARIAFMVFAALCFGGIFASLARGNVR
ncbi:MAG: MFS transporter [Chloroflexota bacterium]